ncbi:hypothetical protein WT60_19470 [Burkholderia sp. MSMB617WGS]|nr:hypothetical protein WT60_19470 [Burkholderia sp. MSMB617WGS]
MRGERDADERRDGSNATETRPRHGQDAADEGARSPKPLGDRATARIAHTCMRAPGGADMARKIER